MQQAFTNFWADRAGPDGVSIQQHLVNTWGRLAGRFADEPTVAGYDLFNEPSPGYLGPVTGIALLGHYYDRTIDAIRAAEHAAGGFSHIVFFEPSIIRSALSAGPPVQPAFTTDDNIVFPPHIYAGTIAVSPLTVEQAFAAAKTAATLYGSTFWVGEWGASGVDADPDSIARFAKQQDKHLVGGTWWVWRQACGDPHMIREPGSDPRPISDSLIRHRCPEGTALGIPDSIKTILARPYPRAAPGQITQLSSDGEAATMRLHASTATASPLDVWVPSETRPMISGTNVDNVRIREVGGGFRIHATAHGNYSIDVDVSQSGR